MKTTPQTLEQIWRSKPPLWLRGLASLYAFGWRVYEGVYQLRLKRRVLMPIPVIGVGSLWAGGVGKTPITIAIARLLHESGRRVAVLTHGYGGSRYHAVTLLEPREYPDPALVGDEAAELRLALPDAPIAVGKWRVRTAEAAFARWSPEVLVLDDGFQHLPLARTLDLALLPAESPLGNGYCLPAGPLREPPSGLKRAGGVILVDNRPRVQQPFSMQAQCPERADCPSYRAHIAPACLLHVPTGDRLPLDHLQNRPLTLICGVARPERFIHTAQSLGYAVEAIHTFPDHHAYTSTELRFLQGKTTLTTVKDAVKLRTCLPASCDAYALMLEATFDQALQQRLLSLFTGTSHERRKL